MNRRNFFKGVIGGAAAALVLPHVGKADNYEVAPTITDAEAEVFYKEDTRRYWWGIDPGKTDDLWQEDIAYQRQLQNMYVERQRHFAAWVEAKEAPRTPFSDWSSGATGGPYTQTVIEIGQSYQPFNTVHYRNLLDAGIISEATARNLFAIPVDDRLQLDWHRNPEGDTEDTHSFIWRVSRPDGFR